jgi:hypothetical protein
MTDNRDASPTPAVFVTADNDAVIALAAASIDRWRSALDTLASQ